MLTRLTLLGPANLRYLREAFLGVAAYAAMRPEWQLGYDTFFRGSAERLKRWRPRGVIALFDFEEHVVDTLAAVGEACVVINLGDPLPAHPLPVVRPDDAAIGRLAATHLMGRGLKRFGYVPYGEGANYFSVQRQAAFTEAVGADACSVCPPGGGDAIARWLRTLKTPCGVFCANDHIAHELAEIAQDSGIRVPYDVAVVGVDDDEILCSISPPPLSSIDPGSRAVGYEAARVMDSILRGDPPPPPNEPILIPPVGAVVRASSDILAIEDREIAEAVRFIRTNAHRPLGVSDVLAEVPMSRRALERRFRAALGHGPADEIRQFRIQRAKDLLSAGEELSMPQIAAACGFSSAVQFSIIFRRLTGQTPTEYRRATAPADRAKPAPSRRGFGRASRRGT